MNFTKIFGIVRIALFVIKKVADLVGQPVPKKEKQNETQGSEL